MRECEGKDEVPKKRYHNVPSREEPLIVGVLIGLLVITIAGFVLSYWIES